MKPPVELPTSRHCAPGRIDPEPLQRVLQLHPAAGDEARRLDHDQLGPGLDHLPRLRGQRAVGADPHPPGAHGGRGGGARGEEAALGQRAVEADLAHARNRSAGCVSGPGNCDRPHTQIAHTFVFSDCVSTRSISIPTHTRDRDRRRPGPDGRALPARLQPGDRRRGARPGHAADGTRDLHGHRPADDAPQRPRGLRLRPGSGHHRRPGWSSESPRAIRSQQLSWSGSAPRIWR